MAAFKASKVNLSPLDIIISCAICQKSISSIYATPEGEHGLRQGERSRSGKVTKLWLTECAHLTCTKHFAGGGVPFHPADQLPQAPCPLCTLEKGDNANKTLFPVNGVSEGEYDSNIPQAYFQTPPVRLGGSDPDLEALRFQYLSLLRFGLMKHKKVVHLEEALSVWESRKPLFLYCMDGFYPLREELKAAKKQLFGLGQDISSIDAVLNRTGNVPEENGDVKSGTGVILQEMASSNSVKISGRSRLAQSSAADLGEIRNKSHVLQDSTPGPETVLLPRARSGDDSIGKRRRVEPKRDSIAEQILASTRNKSSPICSRDAMPPPPLPIRRPTTSRAASNGFYGQEIQGKARPSDAGLRNGTSKSPKSPGLHLNGSEYFPVQNRDLRRDITSAQAPIPEFLPTLNADTRTFTCDSNSNSPNSYLSGQTPTMSGVNAHISPSRIRHGNFFTPVQRAPFSAHVVADQSTPSPQKMCLGPEQKDHAAPFSSLHNYATSYRIPGPELYGTINQPDQTRRGKYTDPYIQQSIHSLGPAEAHPETNVSLDAIAGPNNMFSSHRKMKANLLDYHSTNNRSQYHGSNQQPVHYGIETANGTYFGAKVPAGPTTGPLVNDGEFDRFIPQRSNPIHKPSPRNRISLPPPHPHLVGTPRSRLGMSANIRSSSNSRMPLTPSHSRPHREPLRNMAINTPFAASPYFSHRVLPRSGLGPASRNMLAQHNR